VLAENDLELALAGKFVTRVIYIEDPRNALPVAQEPGKQEWFDARPGEDPLQVADVLGRPVAIVRIGGRTLTIRGSRACSSSQLPGVSTPEQAIIARQPIVVHAARVHE